MKLAVDTNILFSILIGGRKLRKLFLEAREILKLYTPEEALNEIEELLPKAARYLNVETPLVKEIFNTLIKPYLHTTKADEIPEGVKDEARELIGDVDPYDWPFVGLAMYLRVPLWTGDKAVLGYAARTRFKHFVAVDTEGVEMLLRGELLENVKHRMKEKYS